MKESGALKPLATRSPPTSFSPRSCSACGVFFSQLGHSEVRNRRRAQYKRIVRELVGLFFVSAASSGLPNERAGASKPLFPGQAPVRRVGPN